MRKNLEENIKGDTSANTDELQKSILFAGLILTAIIVLICLIIGKILIAKGFLLGAGISLLYFRMQVIFVKNFTKKDFLSKLTGILSIGRILLIAGVLFIAFKRVDLFDLTATIMGLATVHLIIFIVFSYNVFKNCKKKLIIN